MESAKRAVDKIDSAAITEIKGFKSPPPLCAFVMECIMLFLGKKADWDVAKKEMSNATNFLKDLKAVKVENLKEKDLEKIRKKYLDKKDKWDYKLIFGQSQAAAELSVWASALSNY